MGYSAITAQSPTCVSEIFASSYSTISIRTLDNEIYSWGNNGYNLIPNNSNPFVTTPTLINNTNNYSTIEHSDYFTIALTNDGDIYTWGRNQFGELGNGTFTTTNIPQLVQPENIWLKATLGLSTAIALKNDGTIWGWGSNSGYQLNETNTQTYTTPIQLSPDTDWKDVFSGAFQTYAIKTNGSLWVRGSNGINTLLGIGNTLFVTEFTQVGTDLNWKEIIVGKSNSSVCYGIKNDGSLWYWGKNNGHALGNGANSTDPNFSITTPVLFNEDGWISLSTNSNHTIGIKLDGTLWHWGSYCDNGSGTLIVQTPTQIGTDNDWKQVITTNCNNYAIKNDNTFWAWGSNYEGLFGDTTTPSSNDPKIIFQCATSSSHFNEWSDLKLYPNPTSDKIYWNTDLFIEDIKIFDITGIKIFDENTQNHFVDVSHLANGMYIIILTDNENNTHKNKFVKKN